MWSAPYDLSMDAVRADALFVSALQSSDEPSAVQVRQAIATASSELGELGCAARVAQEYGEHPETAARRMRWARTAAARAFGGSPPACQSPPGVRASRLRSPRSRSAATCA
jgi:hypothetical protein